MSLHVNLSSPALRIAYDKVVKEQGIDWALYTYDAGTNDLKVQSTGDGGLEELEEEFSDGRIQYAFVRVVDPNVSFLLCSIPAVTHLADVFFCRANCQNLFRSTGVVTECPRPRKGCFIHTRAQLVVFSAEHTSLSARVMKFV